MADIRTLHDWIAEARERPGMFVRGMSLAELESQCVGWEAALAAHGIEESGVGFNRSFRDWLRSAHELSVACGWARAIRTECSSDEEAWGRFFELFEEFSAGQRRQ